MGRTYSSIHTVRDVRTWIRINGGALKQHGGAPIGQGPVDDVTVSCYPANVCHAAENVAVVVAEHILGGWQGWGKKKRKDEESKTVFGISRYLDA